MLTDAELLRRYVREHTEDAFAELVRRHLNLVYAAALRRTGGLHALAEEIAQNVFTALARQAAQLSYHPTLTGWLYRTTRNVTIAAIRREKRREKLVQTLTAMPDDSSSADSPAEWEQIRPVLDEAMDQLKEQDREIMLLRFFQGLTFGEIGKRLNLSENNARMRTSRALEKLRFVLGKRGFTSTATLAGLLASESMVAAPTGLAASLTTAALAPAPAGAITTFLTHLMMNKMAGASLSAALAAILAYAGWTTIPEPVSDHELNVLRAENTRLRRVLPASTNVRNDEVAVQAPDIVRMVEHNLAGKQAVALSQHRNHGQATPREAFLSYAWAIDTGDAAALARILTFGEEEKESLRTIHAGLPAAIRAQYPTPEDFVLFLYFADSMLNPVPSPDVAKTFVATEIGPGRAAVRRPDATRGGMYWVETTEGWKIVVPDGYCAHMANRVMSNEMLAKLGQTE